ncbi:hypothetical protein EV652_120127 [Kribbella steppae]|uniref:Uncharacterized protein n=1 Tax=Kribbella steppae TaxID=2512223 RepID=A0A4R2GYW3_9ACTN|nr:hypothetical protein EV652_120127 [Kribbella steppae]
MVAAGYTQSTDSVAGLGTTVRDRSGPHSGGTAAAGTVAPCGD